ncbi:MAG: hypothetical protein MUO22_01355 [Sedimentisphaerales bacterium]|jgi:hypothetical protein|nr:hypothetical protein [Sedimentisphaerales bacterium]
MKEEVSLEDMLKEVVEELVISDPEYAELAAMAKWARYKQNSVRENAPIGDPKPAVLI